MKKKVGKYIILTPKQPVGHGQSAAVYLAAHIDTPQDIVALKFFHLFAPEKRVQRTFLRETRIITRLSHPHIIRVLHVDFDRGNPYYVMSYAPGGSLKSKITPGQSLPLEEVDLYIQQIAAAVQHVHDNGMVHNDLKPENVLIANDGTLLLADFGITKSIQTIQAQSTQGAAGTPLYMAPEQFTGHPCMESDQYALGIMAYELLCGSPPFTGRNAAELVGPHLNNPPPSLIDRNTQVTPQLEVVIFRALAKKPEDRFPSVAAFALAFHNAIDDPTDQHVYTQEEQPYPKSDVKQLPGSFCERLRMLRENNNWSVAYLADLMDVDPTTINQWESESTLPDVRTLNKLADTFGVDPIMLFPPTPFSAPTTPADKSGETIKNLYSFYFKEAAQQAQNMPDATTIIQEISNIARGADRNIPTIPYSTEKEGKNRVILPYNYTVLASEMDDGFTNDLYLSLYTHGIVLRPFISAASKALTSGTLDDFMHTTKCLLVLSKSALTDTVIQAMVPRILELENATQRDILLPIYLDASIFHASIDWVEKIRSERFIGNFTRPPFTDIYNTNIQRLINDILDKPKSPLPRIGVRTDRFYSCMIMCAGTENTIAANLYDDLWHRGVRCWFAPEDMRIGDRIAPTIESALHSHDKIILLLTEESRRSVWLKSQLNIVVKVGTHTKLGAIIPIFLTDIRRLMPLPWEGITIDFTGENNKFLLFSNEHNTSERSNRLLEGVLRYLSRS